MTSKLTFTRLFLLRCAVAAFALGGLAGCGGGGGGGGGFGVGVVGSVQQQPVVVAPLTLALTRVGPEAVEVEWTDDPLAASFLVLRDGFALATVNSVSLIDTSVFFNNTYCYRVEGYDVAGQLVSASSTGCISIF